MTNSDKVKKCKKFHIKTYLKKYIQCLNEEEIKNITNVCNVNNCVEICTKKKHCIEDLCVGKDLCFEELDCKHKKHIY